MPYEPLPTNGADPARLADGLDVLRRRYGLTEPAVLDAVIDSWPELVGDAVASRSEVVDLRDGVLRVTTQDPAVADRLQWDAEHVCVALRERLGERGATRLVVSITRRPSTP